MTVGGMGPIVDLTRAELAEVAEAIRVVLDKDAGIYKAAFAIDDGLKIKINEGIWSPPMGTVRP